MTPFVYSSTFLYLTDYIRENTNLDDEQIEKELDLLGENNSSDTVRSLYNEWCSLRFKPIDVPVFRSKKESINLCLDPDKFSEYRYIMKGRKLINITAKEIKYRQHNILLQDLYKVDLPIPPEAFPRRRAGRRGLYAEGYQTCCNRAFGRNERSMFI